MKHTETKKKGNLSLLPFIWVGYSSSSSTLLNRFHLILNTKYTDLILCSLSVLSIFYTSNAICYEWNASSIRWHMDTLRRLRTVEMMPKKKRAARRECRKKNWREMFSIIVQSYEMPILPSLTLVVCFCSPISALRIQIQRLSWLHES